MSTGNIDVVIAVRNERRSIRSVLEALDNQTRRPHRVVVVDDGSDDGTGAILDSTVPKVRYQLTTVTLPRHTRSYVGRPELAEVFNFGLRILKSEIPRPDYVMILGGDHLLPPDYAEKIVARMDEDQKLAVASGWIVGEQFWEGAPRGSSMVVRTDFWESAGGLQFPVAYGWESWLRMKAAQMGFRARSLRDVPTQVSRKTAPSKGVLYGRAMYSLGYFWPYALGRCLLAARVSPSNSLQMLRGFVDHRGVSRLDVSDWVSAEQRRILVGRALQIVRMKGRP
ncbi:MAG TPA: glycosyltransferase family A protein [Nitrososphaerales archaeon]|nr:glycosyltransferase family A protein [Nitrososphaerales archaeon]